MACPLLSTTRFTSIPPRPTQSPGNFSQLQGDLHGALPSPKESDDDIIPLGITILSCISSLPLVTRTVDTHLWFHLGSIAPQTLCVFGRGGWKRTEISISCSCCKELNTHLIGDGSKLGVRQLKRTGPAISRVWHR